MSPASLAKGHSECPSRSRLLEVLLKEAHNEDLLADRTIPLHNRRTDLRSFAPQEFDVNVTVSTQ